MYGVTKLANEGTARVLAADEGLATIGIRPYIVYGPGRDQGLTSGPTVAIPAVLRGEAYRIGFGGSAQYDYARDVAATFVRAAHAATDGAIVGNYPGIRASMAEVVDALVAALPEAADLVTWDEATSLPFPAETECVALERVLGPIPRTPLAEGLAATVAHLRAAAG